MSLDLRYVPVFLSAKIALDRVVEALGGTEDEAMPAAIQGVGRGRILEIEVPMSSTQGVDPHSATKTMFDVVERSFGHENSLALDFNSLESLPPSVIKRVISKGEDEFHDVAGAFGCKAS
ncbi:hypothetical protein GFB56_13590 [Ensifer sp. T173]|uniref:Uncharacterized protein n=1 Tax=Ensifer canadensis TaxID=555315 RepID=A0AAW4FIA4_9HYPH|nr:hypothetical protein [Ensifer canadensis]MBM3091844.1 hypothetical protein [Ensifer canadensis]UBI77938.1 hypothetical protein J3R84_25735 [Ensifer canadensis]